MADLDKLTAALESAAEGSEELDERVGRAFGWWYDFDNVEWVREGEIVEFLPVYTRSIDAALTLVPEGWILHRLGQERKWNPMTDFLWVARLHKGEVPSSRNIVQYFAVTPALAICAAALRARMTEKGEG